MSDIKLFRYDPKSATELSGVSALVEKQIQSLIEKQMETFLGVRFLATEYSTGKTHKGRIDSLGLDENGCPVIIEYKRHTNENVMTQGLFYLDWLLDHRAEFWKLVLDRLGKEDADKIEWSGTRLICIAADFTRYDEHAVGPDAAQYRTDPLQTVRAGPDPVRAGKFGVRRRCERDQRR
jgi:CO dehydrogenase/acetyl-CoA synthase alpha subunit